MPVGRGAWKLLGVRQTGVNAEAVPTTHASCQDLLPVYPFTEITDAAGIQSSSWDVFIFIQFWNVGCFLRACCPSVVLAAEFMGLGDTVRVAWASILGL